MQRLSRIIWPWTSSTFLNIYPSFVKKLLNVGHVVLRVLSFHDRAAVVLVQTKHLAQEPKIRHHMYICLRLSLIAPPHSHQLQTAKSFNATCLVEGGVAEAVSWRKMVWTLWRLHSSIGTGTKCLSYTTHRLQTAYTPTAVEQNWLSEWTHLLLITTNGNSGSVGAGKWCARVLVSGYRWHFTRQLRAGTGAVQELEQWRVIVNPTSSWK